MVSVVIFARSFNILSKSLTVEAEVAFLAVKAFVYFFVASIKEC
jgi:hypothetical protein